MRPAFDVVYVALGRARTASQLVSATGRPRSVVSRALRNLQDSGRVRISAWLMPERQGRRTPVYGRGGRPSVPEPAPMTKQQINARYRGTEARKAEIRPTVKYAAPSPWAALLNASAQASP